MHFAWPSRLLLSLLAGQPLETPRCSTDPRRNRNTMQPQPTAPTSSSASGTWRPARKLPRRSCGSLLPAAALVAFCFDRARASLSADAAAAGAPAAAAVSMLPLPSARPGCHAAALPSSHAYHTIPKHRAAHPGCKVEVGPSLDLTSQQSVKDFASTIAKRTGPLNILVNNAGWVRVPARAGFIWGGGVQRRVRRRRRQRSVVQEAAAGNDGWPDKSAAAAVDSQAS
jgi:NAD(P)-dependent dehydrogenase (short-subunit alcohol dehydrogenase family)